MQGLRFALFLAVSLTWSGPSLSGGKPLVADVTAHRTGQSFVLVESGRIQTSEIEIHAPGATFIKLHFSDLDLPAGLMVEVGDPYGMELYQYSTNQKDAFTFDPEVGDDGVRAFSAMSVSGDTVQVRLSGDTRKLSGFRHSVRIDHYLEGLPTTDPGKQATGPSTDSACGNDERADAVCRASDTPSAFDRSRPVGKVVTTTGVVCTAWRVGAQNRIFTNEHCIASQADVSAAEVWFNFQASECDGDNTEFPTKVSGNTLLAVDETLDFALFTINNFEALQEFGYLGLDVRKVSVGEQIYIPQHGYGQPKQLAVFSDMNTSGLCQIDDHSHDGYGSGTDLGYYCDTVSSSSGSPVISAASGRVIALHHLGGCVNSGAKMSLIWPMVSGHFMGRVPAGDNERTLHNQPPRASISYYCKGNTCAFKAQGSRDPDGAIVKYVWDFGDGKSASGPSVYHSYSSAGTYRVSLSVTDERGSSASSEKSLTISAQTKPPPPVKLGG